MDSLDTIRALVREGRIPEALAALQSSGTRFGRCALVLKAELLQHVGEHEEAKVLLSRLVNQRLTDAELAACEYTLGMLEFSSGSSDTAVMHMQRSISLASRADDLFRVCWSQLQLLHMLDSRVGPDPTAPLLVELRLNATRLGDPQFHAALHIVVGIHDGKRGFWRNSARHLEIASQLLKRTPNAWLDWRVACAHTALSLLSADLCSAAVVAQKAVQSASVCGCSISGPLDNLGHLYMLRGEFDQAVDTYQRALRAVAPRSEDENGILDSLAVALLANGRVDDAHDCVARAMSSVSTSNQLVFQNRHLRLTHGKVLARQRRWVEAQRAIDDVLKMALQTDDPYLRDSGLILQLDVAREWEGGEPFPALLRRFLDDSPRHPSDWFAQYESCLAGASQKRSAGVLHFDRARRICDGLQAKGALSDVERRWSERADSQSRIGSPSADEPTAVFSPSYIAQEVASLLVHAHRPRVLANSIIATLAATNCVIGAIANARASDGTTETLGSCGKLDCVDVDEERETIRLGATNEHEISVTFKASDEIENIATLNAIKLIVRAASDLKQWGAEREERHALWPMEDFVPAHDGTVIGGRMNELMLSARRVASTHVSVLITGESGTGKEIVARAIHHYSPRSAKPFIPFNCTAVPRDMLESQMFGHRRGAFTGADRDYPGLIRAAKDGTLFLDEVGELGLDLQPKLLRFLESGEISPLGEPGPLHINVRIVAATNRNLEELVQEGRFREDLFYRLNVVRLAIPPLRERRDEIPALVHAFAMRAATEFGKGRIRIAEETMEHLLLHQWPGNVRELNNEIRRMIALADTDAVLEPSALSQAVRKAATAARSSNGDFAVSSQDKLAPTIARIEREMIRTALRVHHGRVEAAAQALGISRKGLYLKRQRLGV